MCLPIRVTEEQVKKKPAQEQPQQEAKQAKEGKKIEEGPDCSKKEEKEQQEEEQEKQLQAQTDKEVRGHHKGPRSIARVDIFL